MAKGQRGPTLAVFLLLLPLLSVISYEMGVDFAPAVSAASDCGQDEQPGTLDENMVEDFKLTGSGWFGEDDQWEGDDGWSQEQDLTNRDLSSLTSSFYTFQYSIVNMLNTYL